MSKYQSPPKLVLWGDLNATYIISEVSKIPVSVTHKRKLAFSVNFQKWPKTIAPLCSQQTVSLTGREMLKLMDAVSAVCTVQQKRRAVNLLNSDLNFLWLFRSSCMFFYCFLEQNMLVCCFNLNEHIFWSRLITLTQGYTSRTTL